jgi:Ca2+-transporting ATPase
VIGAAFNQVSRPILGIGDTADTTNLVFETDATSPVVEPGSNNWVIGSAIVADRIYDNVRKAMGFIFAVHVPIAGLALLPLVLGLPIIFGPIHIAFLEMVIDPSVRSSSRRRPRKTTSCAGRPTPPMNPCSPGR